MKWVLITYCYLCSIGKEIEHRKGKQFPGFKLKQFFSRVCASKSLSYIASPERGNLAFQENYY